MYHHTIWTGLSLLLLVETAEERSSAQMHRQWVGKTGAVSACVLYQQHNCTVERKREENKEEGIEESLDENNGLFNGAQVLLMSSAYI